MKNKKKLPWWKKILKFLFNDSEIVIGPDSDLGGDNKLGVKKKVKF